MSDSLTPPKPGHGDAAHSIARAGIASIPLVGNAAVELFQFLLGPPIDRRRQQWMDSMADSLRKLEADARCVLENLSSDEAFIDTLMQASQAAVRTSQQEKLDALRAAVMNAALPHAPDESRQQIFLSWVDSLTVWHLRMLRLFADPPAWFQAAGRQPPQYMMTSSLSGLLGDAYPELKNQRSLFDKLAKDLYNAGLLGTDGLHTMMSANGALEKRATELGNQFLAFITEPTA